MEYDREKKLGEGGCAIVFEGVWNGKPVAVKRIPKNEVTSNEREEDALKTLNHQNAIKLFHVESDEDFRYYVLELCNASLEKLFLTDDDPKKYSGPMPTVKDVLLQLAIGLEHIHNKGLVHRDLKLENVLIWVDPNTQKVIMKWADFGLSKRVNEKGSYSMQSGVKGTRYYLAPEILLEEHKSTSASGTISTIKRGNIKSDVFAEGIVFGYFLLGGVHLFGSGHHIPFNIIENEPPNLPNIQPKDLRMLIQKMLEKDPHKRITSSDVTQELQEIEMSINKSIFAEDTYPSVEEVEKLLQKGMDINSVDEKGLTPLLHLALPKKK